MQKGRYSCKQWHSYVFVIHSLLFIITTSNYVIKRSIIAGSHKKCCSRICNKYILSCVQTNDICPTVVYKLCDNIEMNITLSLFRFEPTRNPIAIWVNPISNWVRFRFGSEHLYSPKKCPGLLTPRVMISKKQLCCDQENIRV